jgi:hypothetical protein
VPFRSQAYLASIGFDKYRSLTLSHTPFGYHPDTQDELHIPDNDRYAGTYVLGVQGSGKSALLQNLITADMQNGHAVIVIDPHGDLVTSCLSHVPQNRLQDTYLLDMEDEDFPFGVNIFHSARLTSGMDTSIAVERLMHIFEVLWPEVMSQQNLPRYLRAATLTLLANPGTTLVDMYLLLQDQVYRGRLVANVADQSVQQFWHTQYNELGPHEQYRRVQPLIGRLEALFMGRSLVRNIVGQRQNTISFRQSIEQKRIVFIKLPTKTIAQDARLIGTILLAQIHAAIFSFANVPQDKRPGVSLYVDEFQHFATSDFSELFTEGRKYGLRLTIAHQYRNQLPSFLQASTMTALSKVCFRLTPEDGREMAHLFPSNEATVQAEDITEHPVHYLLTHPSNDPLIQTFTEVYLHPLQGHRRGAGRVEIDQFRFDWINGKELPNPRVVDPTWQLNSLLYETMQSGNPGLPIPPEVVMGFSGCGQQFYKQARGLTHNDHRLRADFPFPLHLVGERKNGITYWTRKPEGGTEQMYHFIFHLRMVMFHLAAHPIGKATTTSTAEVAKMLTQLPKRAAFVRPADTVGVIYTHNTAPSLPRMELFNRAKAILEHTRLTYCHPKAEVEQTFMQPAQASAPVQPLSRWEEVE